MKSNVSSAPAGKRGIRDRLSRVSHWDVNVVDLERSREFYEATTALEVVGKTSADQVFPSLGLDRGRFRGYLLRDPSQTGTFAMLHLVQWLDPVPVGTAYQSHTNVGWYRICPLVDDIDAVRETVIRHGGVPFAETTNRYVQLHADVEPSLYRVFTCHDPDGIAVEWVGWKADRRAPVTVAHNTADVRRWLPFYVDGLGLDFTSGAQTPGPADNVYSPGGGLTSHDGAILTVRGDDRVIFDWLEWDRSPEHPTPYAEPHHVGVVRCALEVDDLDEAHGVLCETAWARDGLIMVSAPELWQLGDVLGDRRVVNFTDPEGVGFQLIEQAPFPNATLDSYGLGGVDRSHLQG
jgi:catechol 2,3-dioxygenase-like lactoylglutathione lyase family enzyme